MEQANAKRSSKTWMWVVGIILIIVGCCCLAGLVGGFFYLGNTSQTWQEDLTEIIESPEFAIEPGVTVEPLPTVAQLPLVQQPTPLPVAQDMLVVVADSGVWTVNEENRQTQQLSLAPLDAPWDLQEGLSPDKTAFAYLTGFWGASRNPMLMVLNLENQTTLLELELTGPLSQPGVDSMPGDPAFEATRAMESSASLAWSPDGQKLAFVAALDGDSADVYLFDRQDESVTRLSDETGHASGLHWSADGQWIEYVSVESFGTGAGFSMDGLWIVDMEQGQNRLLEEVESAGEDFIAWTGNTTFLINSWGPACESYNLREVDAFSLEQRVLVEGCFSGVAFNPEQQSGMLAVTTFNEEFCSCGGALMPGLYTFGTHLPLKKFIELEAYSIGFIPEAQLFTVYSDEGLQDIFDSSGAAVKIPDEVRGLKPSPSPKGEYWAWASYHSGKTGLWITGNNANPIEISGLFSGTTLWSEDGQTLYFIENGSLFFTEAPHFTDIQSLRKVVGEVQGMVK